MFRKIKATVAILAAVTLAGWISKPDKRKHIEKIAEQIVEAVLECDTDAMDEISNEAFPYAKNLAIVLVNGHVDMKDMGILTVCEDRDSGQTLSVGIMGHVFTFLGNAHDKLEAGMTQSLKNYIDRIKPEK